MCEHHQWFDLEIQCHHVGSIGVVFGMWIVYMFLAYMFLTYLVLFKSKNIFLFCSVCERMTVPRVKCVISSFNCCYWKQTNSGIVSRTLCETINQIIGDKIIGNQYIVNRIISLKACYEMMNMSIDCEIAYTDAKLIVDDTSPDCPAGYFVSFLEYSFVRFFIREYSTRPQ